MFPVGTFAPRSENTGERKVPEPSKALDLTLSLTITNHPDLTLAHSIPVFIAVKYLHYAELNVRFGDIGAVCHSAPIIIIY